MHAHARHHPPVEDDLRLVRDPVCGMSVDPASAKHWADHAGARYFFCSARCREKFEATPARYLKASEPEPAPAGAKDAIYTCPMHPEVRQKGPGSCPICGMALEPEMVTRDEGPSEEYLDIRRRFIVGAVLSIPVVIIAMGRHLVPGLFHSFSADALGLAELILATPVVLWAGWPFFVRGWQSIRSRNLNMFTLIAIGTGAAYAYSAVAALAPGIFPESFRGADGEVGLYFEAAAVIVTLVLLGQVLEIRARERTSGAIRAFSILHPRPRAGSMRGATRQRCRSNLSRSGIVSGCGRATRYRSTGWSWREGARSTSRC
jgi:cation transport ATPase